MTQIKTQTNQATNQTNQTLNFVISNNALKHFSNLLQQEEEAYDLRILVENPGTLEADLSINFCPAGYALDDDFKFEFQDFNLYVDSNSFSYLEDASIDFIESNLGGELEVKAPKIKGIKPDESIDLATRVTMVLDNNINPMLRSHGGKVTLFEVAQKTVKLNFDGGCKGCGMAKITLQNTISKTLMYYCPDITAIEDVTEHSAGTNPYYA